MRRRVIVGVLIVVCLLVFSWLFVQYSLTDAYAARYMERHGYSDITVVERKVTNERHLACSNVSTHHSWIFSAEKNNVTLLVSLCLTARADTVIFEHK